MKRKSFGIIILFIVSIITLAWCSHNTIIETNISKKMDTLSLWDNGKSLQIVTTFPPLYAHAANLIDENDTLTNLVPPGSSVHFWQPKPSDVLAMEQADIIITNGLWLEEFLEDYLDTLEKKWVRIVNTSEWVEILEFEHEEEGEEEEGEEHNEEEHNEEEHHHEWSDPHIRLDPSHATIQVWNILKALIALDPSQEKVYTDHASIYTNELSVMDIAIQQKITAQEIQPFIVFHDAYQYFLHAYNLEEQQVGLIQEFHGDNPSQKQIAELIKTIQEQWVQTIYTEPQFNPSIVKRLEQETWVTAKEIDPIGSELSKDWYIRMLNNLAKWFIN